MGFRRLVIVDEAAAAALRGFTLALELFCDDGWFRIVNENKRLGNNYTTNYTVKATSNLILARRVFRHLAARREEHRALVHDADQQSLESTRLFLRREHAGG